MDKYPELPAEQQTHFLGRVNQRWGQLHALEKDWGEKAYKYLFLTNSGGAIATLSFLGAKSEDLNVTAAKLALALFVVGVIVTGIATAYRLHRVSWLLKGYRQDSQAYFQGKLTWEALYKTDEKRATDFDLWSYLLPYSCLTAFIAGCAVGGFALFGGSALSFSSASSTSAELTAVQLLAACVGILGSVFFSIGVMTQNARSIAAVCVVYAGANPSLIKSYAAQKAEYLIGSALLGLAFVLQFLSLIAPNVGAIPAAWISHAPLVALLATGITYFSLKRLSAIRAIVYEARIQSEINRIYREHEDQRKVAASPD